METDTQLRCPACSETFLESESLVNRKWDSCDECGEVVEEFEVVQEEPFRGTWTHQTDVTPEDVSEEFMQRALNKAIEIKCPECWNTWLGFGKATFSTDRECDECGTEFTTSH